MNKTVVFVCFAALAAIAICGGGYLLVVRPEAQATFGVFAGGILSSVVLAAGTFAALGKQGEKIDEIKRNTNGTLSELRAEIQEKNDHIAALYRAGSEGRTHDRRNPQDSRRGSSGESRREEPGAPYPVARSRRDRRARDRRRRRAGDWNVDDWP
jgi:hypothetical protein